MERARLWDMAGSVPVRALLILGIVLLPGLAAGQGLGGVAREEAHRRSDAGTPGGAHRYTDADLRTEPEDDPGARGEDPAADRDAADPLREELDRASARRKERERRWRERVATVRAQLATARKEHEVACDPSSIALRGG
jgi:hypothetical protein